MKKIQPTAQLLFAFAGCLLLLASIMLLEQDNVLWSWCMITGLSCSVLATVYKKE